MAKMPWEYSKPGTPEKGIRNVPTPEGRELGSELCRLLEGKEEKVRALDPTLPPKCNECAVRLGTNANGSPSALMDLIKCVHEGEPFFCHKGYDELKGEEPKRLCTGFLVMIADPS